MPLRKNSKRILMHENSGHLCPPPLHPSLQYIRLFMHVIVAKGVIQVTEGHNCLVPIACLMTSRKETVHTREQTPLFPILPRHDAAFKYKSKPSLPHMPCCHWKYRSKGWIEHKNVGTGGFLPCQGRHLLFIHTGTKPWSNPWHQCTRTHKHTACLI